VLNKILAFTFSLLPWEIWLWAPEISLLGIPCARWQLHTVHYAPELELHSTRMVAITGANILGTIVDKNLLF
jgi:hypothetical protein